MVIDRGDAVAHSASAKKRIRQNLKHRLRNRRRKDAVREVVKTFETAVSSGQKDQAAVALKKVYQRLDKVSVKGTIHKNTAARKKSRLAKRLNKLAVK
jgi:small subunit ribosomal protein S20